MLGNTVCCLGDKLLAPLNRAASRIGIGPLFANAMELIAAVGAAICFVLRLRWPAVALLAVHGAFDYFEGGLRRATGGGAVSAASVWRHAIVDKVSDVVLLIAIGWGGFAGRWLAIATAASAVAVTGLGLWLYGRVPLLRERVLFDRADRVILLLWAAAAGWLSWALWLVLAMNILAFAHRLIHWARAFPAHGAEKSVGQAGIETMDEARPKVSKAVAQ